MPVSPHDQRLHEILQHHRRIPVVAVHDENDLAPLLERLRTRAISIIEITLRTAFGLEAIHQLKATHPDWVIAAGTVLDSEQLSAAARAGADFIVSPGYLPELSNLATQLDVPLLPGVMTPSDIMAARRGGHRLMKLFPAHVAGGLSMLSSLAGPFPDVMFCPTGGIGPDDMDGYLAQKNVIAVGASWLAQDP